MNNSNTLITYIVYALIFVVFAAYMIVYGWVTSILWAWFVVPIFKVSLLSIPQILGLGTFTAFFSVSGLTTSPTGDDEQGTLFLIKYFVYPWMALGVGYVITLFL